MSKVVVDDSCSIVAGLVHHTHQRQILVYFAHEQNNIAIGLLQREEVMDEQPHYRFFKPSTSSLHVNSRRMPQRHQQAAHRPELRKCSRDP
jgi:hypothetical protein